MLSSIKVDRLYPSSPVRFVIHGTDEAYLFSLQWSISISKDHGCPIRRNQNMVGWVSVPFYFCSIVGDKSFWLRANQPARRRWRWALGNYPPTHNISNWDFRDFSRHFTDDTFKCPTYPFLFYLCVIHLNQHPTLVFSVSSPDEEVWWVTLL